VTEGKPTVDADIRRARTIPSRAYFDPDARGLPVVCSRLYDRGRYSPRREVGTHHVHTLLARLLFDEIR